MLLMLVYGISADRGFDILVWHSQQTNTRLRILAELIVAGFGQCETGACLRTQSTTCCSPHTKGPGARRRRRSRAGR